MSLETRRAKAIVDSETRKRLKPLYADYAMKRQAQGVRTMVFWEWVAALLGSGSLQKATNAKPDTGTTISEDNKRTPPDHSEGMASSG